MSKKLLIAALILFWPTLAAAESMSRKDIKQEREACLASAEGKVGDAKAYCDCLVGGMAEQLTAESYLALQQQVLAGAATPEGDEALAYVSQLAARCQN